MLIDIQKTKQCSIPLSAVLLRWYKEAAKGTSEKILLLDRQSKVMNKTFRNRAANYNLLADSKWFLILTFQPLQSVA